MNAIIEDLLQQDFITKEAAERLEEFDSFIKEAGFLDMLKGSIVSLARTVGPSVVGAAVGIAGTKFLTDRVQAQQKEKDMHQLQSSLSQIMMNNPDLSQDSELASKRFYQMAHFSPTVAKVPEVAGQLLQEKVHKGFDLKDMMNLMQIEASNSQINQRISPTGPGIQLFQQLAPQAIKGFGEGLVKAYDDNPALKTFKLDTDVKLQESLKFLSQNNILPPAIHRMAEDMARLASKPGVDLKEIHEANEGVIKWIEGQGSNYIPGIISRAGLTDQFNSHMKSTFEKKGHVENLSLEKKAAILADQYVLIKHMSKDLSKTAAMGFNGRNALLGLGAAALFGAAGSVAEGISDYISTKKMNEAIQGSWAATEKNLEQKTQNASGYSAGIDYMDDEVKRKAKEAFKVLVDIAPALAANSSIATTFVNRVMANDGTIDADQVKVLSEAQKNINGSSAYRSPFADSPMSQGFGKGFEAAGGREVIRSLAKGLVE